jgi:hypothetical protein
MILIPLFLEKCVFCLSVPQPSYLTSCTLTKSNLYFDSSFHTVTGEPALYNLLTFHVQCAINSKFIIDSLCVTGQPAVDEELHSDNDSVKVRIKLKGRKSESSSLSVRKNVKKSSKKLYSEDDEEEEEEVCKNCAGRRAVFGKE